MATSSILPLFAPLSGIQQTSQNCEATVATVNAPCIGLNSKSISRWLQQENKSYIQLLQAAWSITLQSYTGSDDVWFSCLESRKKCHCHVLPSQAVRSLFNISHVEPDKNNDLSIFGANSATYVYDGTEDGDGNERLRELSEFGLAIYISQRTDTQYPIVGIKYKPSVMSTELAQMIAGTVAKAIEEIVFHIDSLIEALDICSDADLNRLLQYNSGSSKKASSSHTIHYIISRKCIEKPDSVAISSWDGQITYAELDTLSSALGARLQRHGVHSNTFVPLIFDKSKWAVIALLGVLKAGGAYFFLNPTHPRDYNISLCSFLCPNVALCSPKYTTLAKSIANKPIPFGEESCEPPSPFPTDGAFESWSGEAGTSKAMYITFTSGTTGQPKGIITEHSAFYAMAMANGKALHVTSATRMLQFASYTFDVSNRDMLITLIFGGCICIPSEADRLNDLSGFMIRHSVNLASLTPSLASTLTPASCPSLKGLVLGGEPISKGLITTWANHVQLFNAYGVSESTGIAALASDIKADSGPGNIGFGCGSTLWVAALNRPDKLAPIGALGELVIEGPSVARGYLGDAARTVRQFGSSPGWKNRVCEQFGEKRVWERAFHTGDLVRYNPDGSLHFIGRKDHQVKVNGQRLELTAIEHHIAACVDVIESPFSQIAVVVVKSEANGSTKLLAFLGADTSRGLHSPNQILSERLTDKEDLKAALRQHLLLCLPKFMVPVDFIFLQHMPLTASGKVHRLRLQETATQTLFGDQETYHDTFVANGVTSKERVLIETWSEILGIKDASILRHHCFFQRGGDSIAAIKMAARLRERGFNMSVSDIFKFSTLSDMESVLVEANKPLLSAAPAPFSLIDKSHAILDSISEELEAPIDLIEDIYPCTHMQQGLIALTVQNPRAYIGSYTWKLAEGLDRERFKRAWDAVWLYNPILRTRIVQIPEGDFQAVMRSDMPWKSALNITDCGELEEPIDIDIMNGPLLQFHVSKETFRLDIHHSLYDQWSLDLLMAQLDRAYTGKDLHTQPYSPFVRHLQDSDTSTDNFWRNQFYALEAEHFPPSVSRSNNDRNVAEKMTLDHSLDLVTENLTKYTLSSILRLAWAIVLWHQTGCEDVVFGATVSGRNANIEGIDQLSGPTLATLPVRIRIPTSQSIDEVLLQVQDQFVNMMPYEQTGLARIRQVGREAAEACSFQNLLVVQPYERQISSLVFKPSVNSASSSENAKAFASYPMVLICRQGNGRITMELVLDPALLAPAAGKTILKQMSHVISQLMTSNLKSIAEITLIPPEDMAILKKWNRFLPKPVNTCIHYRIRQICIIQPEGLAVHSDNLDLTYAQLEYFSNRFADRLISLGIKLGDFVPILLERSPWVPVIILAVLKTGAAFVLLDLSHPIQRLRTMCSMVNAKMVVSFKEYTHISDKLILPIILFDSNSYMRDLSQQSTDSEPEPVTAVANPDAPACVVFSSGSTGLPKGIVLHHSALTTSAAVMREHGMLSPDSRVFHFASFAFDISIGEILFTLAAGACICVPQEEDRRGNPAKAASDLQVTWALLTPSVINLFDPSDIPTLEILGSAGEPLSQHIVDVWAHKLKLFGMYAPAECTVISHITRILPEVHHSSIGWSHGAVSWVVDSSNHNRLVPIGMVGELIVEGPIVSSGYLNDPEKTNKAFITNPSWLADIRSYSGRLYKTGDLVRQTNDGSLQFVGRKDDQVKLHGQRLEVGEVEHCITSSCTDIKIAAVECIKISEQNNRASLVAFICPQIYADWGQLRDNNISESCGLELFDTPSDQFYSTIESLESSLKEILPPYMIPSFFVPLLDVPLTLSGKVNRRLFREQATIWPLKRLELYQLRSRTLVAEEAPTTAHGRDIQVIIGQALNLDAKLIPMNSNFFGLGGDSISAMHVSMLARRKGIRLTVANIFTEQIISKIALKCAPDNKDTGTTYKNQINGHNLSVPVVNPSHRCKIPHESLPVSLPQELIDNLVEATPATEFQAMTLYNFYSRYLWVALPELINKEQLLSACNQLVEKHSILRTVFYINDNKSVIQLTMRKAHIRHSQYKDVLSLEEHCTDDSLTMGVPINGELGFQVRFVTLKDSRAFLVLRLPHALFDGLSLGIICDDLSSAYGGKPLPPCAQFSDHMEHVWDKKTPETYDIWKQVLRDTSMTTFKKKYMPNWNIPSEEGNPEKCVESEVPFVVTAIAETLPISPLPNITMATLVKLAWAVTLRRLFTSKQDGDKRDQILTNVVFGQVVHGRGLGIPHEERIVGPCLNIIPVRVHFPSNSDKFGLLKQVQEQHIQTMPVENLGLAEITQNCTSWAPGTKFGSFIRFQNFTNSDESTCCFNGNTCETGLYSLPNRPSNTANVLVIPHGLTLTITMTISSQVLDRESADYVVGYFSDVIGSLASEGARCKYLDFAF